MQIHSLQAWTPPTKDFLFSLVPGFSERIHPGINLSQNNQMITRLLIMILGSDPVTLQIITNFDIIWHVIFYWFKIGFMTIFCKKFWPFCFSGDFILEEEGTQVFRVHTVFFAQYVQIIFLVQRSMKPAGYFQNFVPKIYNYRNRTKKSCFLTFPACF